MQLDAATEKRF